MTVERPEPVLLRPRVVAALLSMSRSQVYRGMERGDIPYVQIGRSKRVPRRWVEQQGQVGAA